MKKVMVQFNIPNMTTKVYDQVWENLLAAGHANPKGLIHHVGGPQGNNIVVVDVWESAEAFNKFGETLIPILTKAGVTKVEPVVTPVHNTFTNAETVITR